jgi:hypothetical protein
MFPCFPTTWFLRKLLPAFAGEVSIPHETVHSSQTEIAGFRCNAHVGRTLLSAALEVDVSLQLPRKAFSKLPLTLGCGPPIPTSKPSQKRRTRVSTHSSKERE